MRVGILALVGMAACYNGHPSEGVPCSPDTHACPSNQFCSADNVCVSALADAPVGPFFDAPADMAVNQDDAPPDAGPMPFGAPVLVDLGDPTDALDDPTLTADELQLVINLNNQELEIATRQQASDSFGPLVLLTTLNSPSAETTPELIDDLDIVFASNRAGGVGGQDIYLAGRATTGDDFGAPELVPSLSTSASESPGNLTEDGLQMVITSSRPGGKGRDDLYIATRPNVDADFEPAVNLAKINTSGDDEAGFFADGGRTLYYSVDLGAETHIFVAHRATLGDDFGSGTELTELEMGGNETDPWLSPDGKRLYFMSSASGTNQIYMASR